MQVTLGLATQWLWCLFGSVGVAFDGPIWAESKSLLFSFSLNHVWTKWCSSSNCWALKTEWNTLAWLKVCDKLPTWQRRHWPHKWIVVYVWVCACVRARVCVCPELYVSANSHALPWRCNQTIKLPTANNDFIGCCHIEMYRVPHNQIPPHSTSWCRTAGRWLP